MIDDFLKQLIKIPNEKALYKAKLEVIDWIGYSIAGTKTNQAKPFYNLQKNLPNKQKYLKHKRIPKNLIPQSSSSSTSLF